MASCSVVTALGNGMKLVLTVGLKIHSTLLTGEVSLFVLFCVGCLGYLVLIYITFMTSLLGHRDIQAVGVRCNNVERGCGWEGTVGTLEDHVTKCDFTMVPCPNGCEESGIILHLLRKEF